MDLVGAPDASVAAEVAEDGAEVMNWSDAIAGGDDGAEGDGGGGVTHAMITADGRAVPVTYDEETGQYVTEDGQAVVVQGPNWVNWSFDTPSRIWERVPMYTTFNKMTFLSPNVKET